MPIEGYLKHCPEVQCTPRGHAEILKVVFRSPGLNEEAIGERVLYNLKCHEGKEATVGAKKLVLRDPKDTNLAGAIDHTVDFLKRTGILERNTELHPKGIRINPAVLAEAHKFVERHKIA